MSVRVETYAKINLNLRVYPPVPSGLHPLCSIFQRVSLSDILHITQLPSLGFVLETDHPSLQEAKSNLLWQIYHDFCDKIPFGLSVFLEKRIPVGGGLGGGSSNAAGFLQYLNKACEWGLSVSEQMTLGARYGSDVPYFFLGGTALVQKTGEAVMPWPTYSGAFLLCNPGIAISTAQVFHEFDQTQPGCHIPPEMLISQWRNRLDIGHNDLAAVVLKYPVYRALERVLMLLKKTFFLSGSGATVFVPVATIEEATQLAAVVAVALPDWWVCPVTAI